MKKFLTWVVLCGVPLVLLTPGGLSCIASAIKSPLSLDKATEQRRRVHFARVCAEVACGDDLPDTIMVDIEEVGQVEVSVEYAWKPIMYTLCKSLGHSDQFCKATKEWRPKPGHKEFAEKVPTVVSSDHSKGISIPKTSEDSIPQSSVGHENLVPSKSPWASASKSPITSFGSKSPVTSFGSKTVFQKVPHSVPKDG